MKPFRIQPNDIEIPEQTPFQYDLPDRNEAAEMVRSTWGLDFLQSAIFHCQFLVKRSVVMK